jgi:flagellar hook-length control protein FliK
VVQAGYRTLNPQGVQLLDQARDSVFRQILFKLGKDGSEMRMRLEPPDLGELNLHMVVEKGGNMRLSIGAERHDLAQMLQQHLPELQQTLQQGGLNVTHAEVHTQSGSAGHRGAGTTHDFLAADADEEAAGTTMPQRISYVSSQGLDFWV